MTPLGIDKVTRLVVLFTLLMVLLLVGGGWTFHGLMIHGFRDAGLQAVRDQGRLIRSLLEAHPDGPTAAWRAMDHEAMRQSAGLDRLELVPATADRTLVDVASPWGIPPLPDSLREELELGFEVVPEHISEDREFFQSIYEPLLDAEGLMQGFILLEAGDRTSRRMAAMRRGLWIATGLGGLFTIFVFIAMSGILNRVRKHQRQLDRAEHLAGVGTLAAGLAHEIRNPLAIIAANAELIEMRGTTAPEREKADDILEEVERLQRLLGDFLHFARPSELQLTPLDYAAFWRRTLAEQGELYPEIVYDLDTPADLPVVTADADRLRQLALNLLGNAAQIQEGEGRIRVLISRKRDRVRVRIQDAGPGVPVELRDSLFQPFVSRRQGGSGLGLAVCRTVARAHGGALYLGHSGPDGSEFILDLPLTAKPSPAGKGRSN
ncbi:MAG: hypothetical protein GY835_00305 [bacterium]|nr:hypothetical protein [bacterium]